MYYSILLGFICIALFLLQPLLPMKELILTRSAYFKPWQFLTYMFLHGNFTHLFYNVFAIFMFGCTLEHLISSKKFLFIYFSGGLLVGVITPLFYDASLGASGAIFAIIGALTYLRPRLIVFVMGVPMPLVLASIFWAFIDLIGAFYPDNIAHISHLIGLIIGILIATRFKEYKERKRKVYEISDEIFDEWEQKYMRLLF